MQRRNAILANGNRLKLGVFGANCSSGRTYATIPERWEASWENNQRLALLADRVGIECLIPIARWRGYGGASNPNGSSFESITWACGLLAATRRINVFCTVHVPLNHPLVAAKQLATADLIGQGRLGLNLVCGWNADEFRMFGVSQLDHEARYDQGIEWWSIVRRVWAGEAAFDHLGHHYQLRGVVGAPSPFDGQSPLMMNAGTSPAGRRFAIQNSDLHFDGVEALEGCVERVSESKRLAHAVGRRLQVWTPIGVVCRATNQEADDWVRYVVGHGDWGAVGYLSDLFTKDDGAWTDPGAGLRYNAPRSPQRRILARGNYCVIGDPDTVADELAALSNAGFDGLALNFVNYLDELPYFAQEVLPRLERRGLRAAFTG